MQWSWFATTKNSALRDWTSRCRSTSRSQSWQRISFSRPISHPILSVSPVFIVDVPDPLDDRQVVGPRHLLPRGADLADRPLHLLLVRRVPEVLERVLAPPPRHDEPDLRPVVVDAPPHPVADEAIRL